MPGRNNDKLGAIAAIVDHNLRCALRSTETGKRLTPALHGFFCFDPCKAGVSYVQIFNA